MTKEQIYDRMMGCLYGQAIGDALGLGGEGQYADGMKRMYPNKLQRYDEIIPFAHVRLWKPGEFTDDTDQMLCILNALFVLFADELFHWNLLFRIRNAEDAEPSDWEIAGRYVGWTAITIMAFVIFIIGLQ